MSELPANAATTTPAPWSLAVLSLERWIEQQVRLDRLVEDLPRSLVGVARARCQHLLYGALRHRGRVDRHLFSLVTRPPRARLQALFWVAGFELLEGGEEGHAARVVHHAVGEAKSLTSEPEARMANAVLRKLATALAADVAPGKLAAAEPLGAYYSHPEWLVQRWLVQWGAPTTRKLLEWNQAPAPVYARWRLSAEPVPAWLEPTAWPTFYRVTPGHWPEVESALAAGHLYLQDPSTRLAVDLLAPQAGESILDGCASPGGKCLAIADRIARGCLVAVDLPGDRIQRLQENLGRIRHLDTALVEGDIGRLHRETLAERNLPTVYDAVLLDVPCSNTGVMRHRVDVRWRLSPNDFRQHARQQGTLLWGASRWVAPGGRLVYSTCSLDAEENAEVVSDFVERSRGRFSLEKAVVSYPWESGHDGAGAFLLRRARE